MIYGLSNLSYVAENTPFSGQLPYEIFNIHTIVDAGGVAILIAYHMMVSELHMKLEMENMQNILNMQYINYRISEKSVDMVNQKYHDLKHQIALLREEFGTKEGLEYLDRMQSEIEIYEAKRLIHVAVAKQKGFLRIRVENCYEGVLVFENCLPRTTKKDSNYHGYGLKSIRSTVKKYNWSVATEAKDGWFELRILIPVL